MRTALLLLAAWLVAPAPAAALAPEERAELALELDEIALGGQGEGGARAF